MMDKIIKKKIGKETMTYVVRGEDLHDVEMEAKKLSFYDVPSCGICNSDSLYLTAYITEKDKFKYLKVVCRKCKASLTFGQRKDEPGTYFLRKNDSGALDWKVYDGKDSKKQQDEPDKAPDGDDIPF